MSEEVRINCIYCLHFNVSWDSRFPNGCKLFGVKSKLMPARVVREATGSPCGYFTPKMEKRTK